ncbi:hypothetical protein HBI56_129120 [Parastagonospora nodorum]|uniref:Uncharacterized protein n=1 Tax=Phaeosphaeria nodorum (strain SN15 / ATCC MYA-4574 / FGSC 10173) TaxID=321614 RepID=A0A7U2EZJ2_PHANO|nr:hypothetical protein HBH56_154720 [Parastagonospora nodorum]QRC95920.1 hypothetical protein JI435_055580 [Parastagonospora nodorum SN15]KAH3926506.1 hypothetical protein HBH54_162970 [Parastagonospora nodorum]KAH3943337.1 hypothetical protein HBH53_176230 [Parastagonospora nodorum]KAH3970397.1 hypothetical protein HBH52_167890 [Parastagonospora nodorum]
MAETDSTHTSTYEDEATNTQHGVPQPPPLPVLTNAPKAFPGCCLALSAPLIEYIHSLLPPAPALTLSIGSGFGLLEAHVLAVSQPPRLLGVEVEKSPNQYLPAANHRLVHGTRFLEPLAAEAATWLFVYPRRVGLVNEYLHEYGQGIVETIIWIGPQADWADYIQCFARWDVQIHNADEVGGRAWDTIAVVKKL